MDLDGWKGFFKFSKLRISNDLLSRHNEEEMSDLGGVWLLDDFFKVVEILERKESLCFYFFFKNYYI